VPTQRGYVLVGGGDDVDSAYLWALKKCWGGDFLVLRTTPDDVWNEYFFSLGTMNSVATIAILNRDGAYEDFVINKVQNAEGIHFAGGDQWTYYNNWKDTPVQAAIRAHDEIGIPFSGTSAGLAILGQFVYTAEFDTVYSDEALDNPYNKYVTIGENFLNFSILNQVITDSHFAQRDRMGRYLTFIARLLRDRYTGTARGIAIDEATALMVETNGTASIASNNASGSAYIIKISYNATPSVCEPDKRLTFENIPVFKVSGNNQNVFNLKSWVGYIGIAYELTVNKGTITAIGNGGNIY